MRPIEPEERDEWRRLRRALWPEVSEADHGREQEQQLADPDRHGVLVASRDGGELAGFVEVSLRASAEGCVSSPVGYVEGWYVEPAARRAGVGRALIQAAEAWAADRGCREMASDAALHNEAGQLAHRALGFEEVERAVLFRKGLGRSGAAIRRLGEN